MIQDMQIEGALPASQRARSFAILHKPDNCDAEYDDSDNEIIITILCWILKLVGFEVTELTREEAARDLLSRPIKIMYQPTILEMNRSTETFE